MAADATSSGSASPKRHTRRGRGPSADTVAAHAPASGGPTASDAPFRWLPDPEPVGLEAFHAIDRTREALLAQATGGISPASLALATFDWWMHLAFAPGKQMELGWKAWRKAARFGAYVMASITDKDTPDCIQPLPGDHRFRAEAWRESPFRYFAQAFLLQQQWWHNVTREVPGVTPHHEEVVSFAARQILDLVSPSNLPFANPEILARTRETAGGNLLRGMLHLAEDMARTATRQAPPGTDAFAPGRNVAITPGSVVFRNHLIELIQYAPATETVLAEPVLIVPAWIMKYYILDLSPENSLIRYLVERGHTVFCISWRNPGADDRDLSLDDYRRLGVSAALDAVSAIVPGRKVHAAGYCLGGTLLAIAAAALAHSRDNPLGSVSFLAAQTDFSEPGELALFIDDSQTHFLESVMWNRGYLSADQMAAAFQMLRSNDLIWSRLLRDYLMGERTPMTDMTAWNADATRMPYRMHAEYLHRLYLGNDLAAGRFLMDGRPAVIQNIRAPMFVVGTERDHVAPWTSVYKIHHLSDTDTMFVLASGGHNAGIVSPPGNTRAHYRIAHKAEHAMLQTPEDWVATARWAADSWWPEWSDWLASQGPSTRVPPPAIGAPEHGLSSLLPAPGSYVLQK